VHDYSLLSMEFSCNQAGYLCCRSKVCSWSPPAKLESDKYRTGFPAWGINHYLCCTPVRFPVWVNFDRVRLPQTCCEAKPLPVCFCVGGFVVWWSKFAHSSIISIDPPRSLSFPFDSISTSSGLTRSLSKVISLEKIGTGS
jgi:hypothetical protein